MQLTSTLCTPNYSFHLYDDEMQFKSSMLSWNLNWIIKITGSFKLKEKVWICIWNFNKQWHFAAPVCQILFTGIAATENGSFIG